MIAVVAALVGAAAPAQTNGGTDLNDSPAPLVAACTLPAKAAGGGDRVCALFAERLAAALPGREVRLAADPAGADLRLEVTTLSPGRLEARIAAAGAPPGAALGTARADAPLDDAAIAAFLDALIADAALPP